MGSTTGSLMHSDTETSNMEYHEKIVQQPFEYSKDISMTLFIRYGR